MTAVEPHLKAAATRASATTRVPITCAGEACDASVRRWKVNTIAAAPAYPAAVSTRPRQPSQGVVALRGRAASISAIGPHRVKITWPPTKFARLTALTPSGAIKVARNVSSQPSICR